MAPPRSASGAPPQGGAAGGPAEPDPRRPLDPGLWTSNELRALPPVQAWRADCACARLQCAGWESITAPLVAPAFRRLGALRDPANEEPTVEEVPGSRFWAVDAPIAPAWFPYNRCEVWACAACGRGFLQYTEYGGYYVDHRVRQIDPALVA